MLEALYNRISDLPKPEAGVTPDPLVGAPPGKVRCACGAKFISLTDIVYHQTGIITASDTECRECLPGHKNFALVICLKCKSVVAKMAPGKFKGGFEMVANGYYHISTCPNCHPGIKVSHVIEKYVYDKAHGNTVPATQDVLPI
jgi:hypothetical protein